jgi:hypothetical protein
MLQRMEQPAIRAKEAAERASNGTAFQSCSDGDARQKQERKADDEDRPRVAAFTAANLAAHTRAGRTPSPQMNDAAAKSQHTQPTLPAWNRTDIDECSQIWRT